MIEVFVEPDGTSQFVDTDTDEDLRLLLAPGSSLGGARPKAAVLDADGSLAIAKFPAKGDEYHIELWSCVALELPQTKTPSTPASFSPATRSKTSNVIR